MKTYKKNGTSDGKKAVACSALRDHWLRNDMQNTISESAIIAVTVSNSFKDFDKG